MPDALPPSFDPVALAIGREHKATAIQDAKNPWRFVLSTESVDRMGDIIEASGWRLAAFKKNPIALWAHDHRSPIGVWEDIAVQDGVLSATLKMAAHGTSPFINTIRSLIEQRILRAVSVGFRAIKAEPIEGSKVGGIRFTEQELLEASVVSVPANPEALAIAKSFSVPPADLARLFVASGHKAAPVPARAAPPAPPPASTTNPTNPTTTGTRNMKIAERIAQMEADLLSKRDSLTALTAKDSLDESETVQFEALPDEIATLERSIASWKKAQYALAAAAQPAGSEPGAGSHQRAAEGALAAPRSHPTVPAQPRRGRAADLLVQAALVSLRSHTERRAADEIVERDFGDSRELQAVVRAATNPAQTGVTGWAAELMEEVTMDFQDMLMPESIWRRLPMQRMSFDNGKIRLPGRSARGLAGDFVAEGQPIPVRQTAFASVSLEPYKMAVITALTRELAKYSNPQAIPILRQAMIDDTIVTLDSLFLDANAAVATLRPAGLQATATGSNTRVSSGTTLANVITDLKAATAQMSALNMGRRPVWVMNTVRLTSLSLMQNASGGFMFRDELAGGQGTLVGIPVLHSTTVPSNVVFLIDASELATAAEITPEIEISTEAALHMESTASTANAAGTGATAGTVAPIAFPAGGAPGGTPGTPAIGDYAQPVRSLFQTYSLALRMIWPVDWTVRRAGAVQTITGVAW
jgi:HK97 family phage major capsid protein/HK97 family phage prohead protease